MVNKLVQSAKNKKLLQHVYFMGKDIQPIAVVEKLEPNINNQQKINRILPKQNNAPKPGPIYSQAVTVKPKKQNEITSSQQSNHATIYIQKVK